MKASARRAHARQIIDRINYLTLATVSKAGEPWNAPVFFAHDNYTTFYWESRRNVQHSQNILANGKVYAVIYDSTVVPGEGQAVYMQLECAELDNVEEVKIAIELLHERFGKSYMTSKKVQGDTHRLYKATLKQAWVKNEKIDVREEVPDM